MKIKNIFFGVLISGLLFVSCSKDGNDGAIGPQGPQGDQGVAGPTGAQGEQGETGAANVIYSDWIQANFLNPNAASQNVMGLATLSDTEFNIINDLVIVYAGNNVNSSSYEIFQLPYTYNAQNEFYGFGLIGDGGGNSNLQVRVNTLDNSTSNFSYIDFYRYIIIPGGVSTGGKSAPNLDYSKMTYEEIVEHFNIAK